MKTFLHIAPLSLSLVLIAACGDDSADETPADIDADTGIDVLPDATDTTPDGAGDAVDRAGCPLSLAIDGDATVFAEREERFDIAVLVSDCEDAPVAGEPVRFEIVGEAEGAQLRTATVQSDDRGAATATVVAGTDASFDVVATAGDAEVTFGIRVSSDPAGDIEVTIVNGSGEDLAEYSAFLFEGVQCPALDAFDLLGAIDLVEPITSVADPVSFAAYEPAADYVVAVQGRTAGDALLGWGCVEDIEVVDRQVTEIDVTVELIPILFSGIYDLDNRFDLGSVLPASVETTLRILDEMTDDDSLGGSTADDEYGVDPAAFILDFIFRELCCWEALDTDDGTPGVQADWDSCRAQDFTHDRGDLQALYEQDFTSWEGAQPSVTGMCGALEFAYEPLQTALQDLIEDYVPDVAVNLLNIVGDLSRSITEMHILSELTVGDVAVEKNGSFTHVLEQMVVELRDLDGETATHTFDLSRAGFDNLEYTAETTASNASELVIPEHSFQLDFGKLLRFIFTDVLIPTLDCDHDGDVEPCEDTADLLGTWVDCDEVAALLVEEIGILTENGFRTACTVGIATAGGAIENALESATDAETTITLSGTTLAGEVDEFREATTLVDGEWSGSLVEDETSYGEFDGTFSGERVAELTE